MGQIVIFPLCRDIPPYMSPKGTRHFRQVLELVGRVNAIIFSSNSKLLPYIRLVLLSFSTVSCGPVALTQNAKIVTVENPKSFGIFYGLSIRDSAGSRNPS